VITPWFSTASHLLSVPIVFSHFLLLLPSTLFYFILFYSTPLLSVSGMEGEEEEVDFNEAFKGVEIVDLRE
jgi:hypothetical protein